MGGRTDKDQVLLSNSSDSTINFTFPQLLPATSAEISPPSLLAAVMALSVIGPSVLSSCSAMTRVDAFLVEIKCRKVLT